MLAGQSRERLDGDQVDGLIGSNIPWPEIICLVFLVLYIGTAYAVPGWRDNPEFADAAYTLGVAHPAGFPTYSLLAKMAIFLPLGSIPFRVAAFSGLAAVAALYLLYLSIQLIAMKGVTEDQAGKPVAWAAATATIIFGLNGTFWTNATQLEVYTLNLCFLGLVIYGALRWSSSDHDAWLFGGSLIYGLASGNHATVAFFLPGLLTYMLLHHRPGLGGRLFWVVVFFLLGFSVYLYLPIRAGADPPFNFGNPDTWERFLNHITNQKNAADNFSGMREGLRFFDYLWIFLSQTVPRGFWPVGLPLVAFGIRRIWRFDRPLLTTLGLMAAANLVFFIRWTNPTAFLPLFYIMMLLSGVGLAWLLSLPGVLAGDRGFRGQAVAVLGLTGIFLAGAWVELPDQDRSGSFLSLETFRTDFENVAPDALVLSTILWFHHRAFQDIYRMREDVTVVGRSDLLRPEWFNPVTPERFPNLAVPPDPHDRPEQGEYLKRFLAANLDQGRDIYWEPFDLERGCFYPNLKPELELLFKVTTEPVGKLPEREVGAALGRIRAKLEREIRSDGFLEEEELHAYYVTLLMRTADYLNYQHHPAASVTLLELLENLFGPEGTDTMGPESRGPIQVNLGVYLLALKRYEEALRHFEAAVEIDRYDALAWTNLGAVRLKLKQTREARGPLERAVELKPELPEAWYNLGDFHVEAGDLARARECYQRSLKLMRVESVKAKIVRRLEQLDRMEEQGS
jgi:tetratricopeptide (TPR) repeat protein